MYWEQHSRIKLHEQDYVYNNKIKDKVLRRLGGVDLGSSM